MKFLPFFKNEIIEFHCREDLWGLLPEPVPAYKEVPEWFKKVPTIIDTRDAAGAKAMSAKKCMPLLDSMSLGFIIPLFADVNVRTNESGSLIEATSGTKISSVIEFHSKEQLGGKTSPTYPMDAIKFINHWIIKTAPGYSTLFMPPLNRIEPRFQCLSGFVDTDKYNKEVNFPGIWFAKNFDDIVLAGTPLVTVIPVRRKDMKRSAPIRKSTKEETEWIRKTQEKQVSRRHVYTNELREPRK